MCLLGYTARGVKAAWKFRFNTSLGQQNPDCKTLRNSISSLQVINISILSNLSVFLGHFNKVLNTVRRENTNFSWTFSHNIRAFPPKTILPSICCCCSSVVILASLVLKWLSRWSLAGLSPCSGTRRWSCCSQSRSPCPSDSHMGRTSCDPSDLWGTEGQSWTHRHAHL